MAVCEECWTEASRRVMMSGGSVVDRYKKLISDPHPGHVSDDEPDAAGTGTDRGQ